MLIDEYLVKLGVIGDVEKAKEFKEQLLHVTEVAKGALEAVGALVAGMTAWFAETVGELDELGTVAEDTGTSVAYLQEFGYAASQMGASAATAVESIKGLAAIVGEAANGVGRGKILMEKFGISVKDANGQMRDMGDIIGQIQNKMQGMSVQQQGAFLRRMGISPEMRGVMAASSEEFQKLIDQAREWGVYGEENAAQATKILNRFKDLRFGIEQFAHLIGLSLIPVMDQLIGSFKEWFRTNHDEIQDGLTKTFTLVAYFLNVISNVVKALGGWRNALMLLGAAWLYVNRAMLLNPFNLIIVALVALALLVDDFMNYLQGKKSLLGAFWQPLIEWCKIAWGYIMQLVQAFEAVWEVVAPIAKFLALIFGDVLVSAIEIFGATAKTVFGLIIDLLHLLAAWARGDMKGFVQAFVDAFNHINEMAQAIFGSIAKLIDNTLGRAIALVKTAFMGGSDEQAVRNAANAVAASNRGVESPTALAQRYTNIATATTGSPLSGSSSIARGINTHVTQDVTVNIQSTDPAAAGRETQKALESASRTSVGNSAQFGVL